MAETIRGISVQIGSDTTGLSAALRDVNQQSRNIQGELRQVERLLQLDPSNTELVAQQQRLLSDAVATSREKLNRLRAAQEQVNEQFRRGEISEGQYRAFQREVAATEQQLRRFEDRLEETGRSARNLGQELQNVGRRMADVGRDLSMKLTAPIVAMGAVAAKVGSDFEAAMSEVGAISGATGGDLEKLEAKAKEMGSSTSKSATEAAEAMSYMSLAGWDASQVIAGIEPMLRLAEAGKLDLARASDLATDSMSALGVSVEGMPTYLDTLAQSSRKSNTAIDQMMEAYLKVGGTFNNLEVPLAEGATSLGILANRGLKGAEAGQALSSILVNLTAPTGQAADALSALGFSAFDSESNFKGLETILFDVKEKLSGLTQEEQNQLIAMIAGKEQLKTFQALLDGLGNEYSDLKTDIEKSNGALDDMAATMQDNLQGRLTALKSALEGVSIQIYEAMLPALEKIVAIVQNLVNAFANLGSGTQTVIVILAGLAAALGPVLIAIGLLSTGISATIGAVVRIGGLLSRLPLLFTALTGPIGIAVLAITGLVAAGIALKNHLSKDALPEIERFGEGVSEATQEAVGGFIDLNEQATQALNELNWSGQAVTAEITTGISEKFDQMGQQVLAGLEQYHTESLSSMQQFFAESSALTAEEEAAALAKMQEGHELKRQAIEEANERIKEILTIAQEERRALTESEKQEINQIQQDMVDTGIKVLSESEIESKIIMERMKQNASILSAQQAAEVVQNSNEQKEKAITAANEQYDQVLAEIIRQRDETGSVSEEQAQKLIEEATRQRDETIEMAEDMHNQVVDSAKAQAGEHVAQVDWETGELLSKWKVFKNSMDSWIINFDTSMREGFGKIRRGVVQDWENLCSSVLSKASELKTETIEKLNDVWDHIKSIPGEARDWGEDIIDALVRGIKSVDIPTPHFDFDIDYKTVAGVKMPVPDVDVDWYAKGGVFTRPVLAGFGDVEEAIVPFEGPHAQRIASLIAKEMPTTATAGMGNITIQVQEMNVRNDQDIPKLAREIYKLSQNARRVAGIR